MKKIRKMLLCVLVFCLVCSTFSACSKDDGNTLKIFNWGDYMDPAVLEKFKAETGIKVIYDEFETNEDMLLKIKNSGSSSYDVCIPSDYTIVKMINEDLLAPIDFDNVPNYANVDDRFKNQSFDPKNTYSVPYQWGTVCIAYDPAIVKEEVNSWDILWDKKYEKQIFMMNSERDSIGVALMSLGYSINTKNLRELDEAKAKLLEQKPLLITYTIDDVKDKMANNEGALALMWSCDVGLLRAMNDQIQFAIPESGTNIWYDSAVILKNAPNKQAAEQFINFLCRPDIAEMNRVYLDGTSPIKEVIDALPAEIRNDPVLYPSAEMMAKSEVFENLSDMASEYERIWSDVIATSVK